MSFIWFYENWVTMPNIFSKQGKKEMFYGVWYAFLSFFGKCVSEKDELVGIFLGGSKKTQMVIWYFARVINFIIVIMVYATSLRWFSSHKDIVRISAINFTFIFFFLAILHLNFLSLKLTAAGDKTFPLVGDETKPWAW